MARKRTTPLISDFDNIPAEALVPKDEQPYEIPGHWNWVRLGALFAPVRGVTYKKGDVVSGGEESVLVLRGGNVREGALELERADNVYVPNSLVSSQQLIQKNDAVIVSSTGSPTVIGRVGLSMRDETDVAFGAFLTVARATAAVDSEYLGVLFQSDLYRPRIRSLAQGVNINNIKSAHYWAIAVPLPPIDEQKAIVEKLQSTNQKIDDVLDRLDQFLDQVPQQRAVIIQAGVSGMLTEDWRAEHGQSREDWVESTLGDTFRWASGGTPARSNKAYFQGHIPWIKSGELPDGLIEGVAEYITEDAISNSSAKVFPKDSVAIAMYGATIGRTGILAFDAATNQAVAVAAKNEEVDSRLLFYFLQASRVRFVSLGKGGAQPNISQTVIKSFPFEYPVGDEQGEIVAVIEAALRGIETAYKTTLDVREKAQAAKRAVRNRALRGIV